MTAQIKSAISRTIYQLWGNNEPNKAAFAALRNSNSMLNRNATVVWPQIMENMQREELSKDGRPTKAELAVFVALRCYALYQQGNDLLTYADKTSNGKELFAVLSSLRKDDLTRKAIDRRVQAVLGSSNVQSVINALYHLVSILKASSTNNLIDFAQLGQDLFYFQLSNELARQICLKWGQQYYWNENTKLNEKED